MTWSKGDLIDEAYAEMALAGYEFDITPEEKNTAVRRLDTMMATWAARGINLGYNFGTTPTDTVLTADSGLQLIAVEAVYSNLALRLCAGKGKTIPVGTARGARQALDALLTAIAKAEVQEQQLPNRMGRGAGNKPWRTVNQPFMPRPNIDPTRNFDDGDLAIVDTNQGVN